MWNCKNEMDLAERITIPSDLNEGLYKCRVLYAAEIESVEFIPYKLPVIRSLKLITDDEIEYAHKYEDRSRISRLFESRGSCDDILIIKNGLVTDTSFCNTVFYDGKKYYTPAMPLLNGTKRQQLLQQKKIEEKIIRKEDLNLFQKIYLINAMVEMEDQVGIEVANVVG